MTKQIVLGLGQIGTAVKNILECDGYDPLTEEYPTGQYDILHICFPWDSGFVFSVNEYRERLGAKLVVVHSTVPVGTCDALGAVMSPCRGIHPDLELGIRTFDKYFGGKGASEASKLFSDKISGQCVSSEDENAARTLEAAKLWDTTQYGLNIMIEKGIAAYCETNGLDFKMIYTMMNQSYNEGYAKLGHPEYAKYVLTHKDGPIGGHCVLPNAELLDHPLAKLLLDLHSKISDS